MTEVQSESLKQDSLHEKLHREIDERLEEFERYLRTMEEFLERESKATSDEQARFYEVMHQEGKDIDDYTYNLVEIRYSDNLLDLDYYFPDLLSQSFLVNLIAYLEAVLNAICRHYEKQRGLSLGLRDVSGRGIRRARNYIKKVAQVDFPDNTQEWRDILKYSELRNCIVHNDAKIDEKFRSRNIDEFKRFLQERQSAGLLVLTNDHLILYPSFCNEVLETVRRFLGQFG